jgi:DNA-directed RNA polymerase specialized sigma24 family protein
MRRAVDGSTSSTLLREVADWHDHPAWVTFRGRYDPHLRRWCRGYGLDDDAIDEVSQRIWIELADRMRTFEYDPERTFRGWLRRLCESRVIDFLRERGAGCFLSLNDRDGEGQARPTGPSIGSHQPGWDESAADPFRLLLLEEGEKIQAAVRARIKPWNWDAFWLVAVCDWTVDRTAQALGMTHTAVYAARERVARMLHDEGKRVLDRWAAGC